MRKIIMSNPLIFVLIGPTGLWILIPLGIAIKKIIEKIIKIIDPSPMMQGEETSKNL